jgi:hypothetical protein
MPGLESQAWTPPGPRMLCGWRCGTRLTAGQMRAHSATCTKRPAGSDRLYRRARNPQADRARRSRDCDIQAAGGAQEVILQNQGEPTTAQYVRSKAVVVFGVDVGALF